MGTLSNNSKVGDKGKDLILQTSGRVYVQVKDRFYEINFRGEGEEEEKEEDDEEILPQIIIVENEDSLFDMTYPGDAHIIITEDGKIFISENQDYKQIPIQATNSSVFSSPITINTQEAPLIISSSQLVKNLNAEYLSGIRSSSFIRVDLPQSITTKWDFNSITIKQLSDPGSRSLINLEDGILSIDTINVKNLNIESESKDESEDSNSEIDIINKPTYFSGGIKIQTSKEIDKVDLFFKRNNTWDSYNENAKVGGFSIYELINEAYDAEYLNTDIPLEEYLNLLTTAYVLDDSSNWIPHTVTSEDLEENNEALPVDFMRFHPKSRDIFKEVPYQSSTCAEKYMTDDLIWIIIQKS